MLLVAVLKTSTERRVIPIKKAWRWLIHDASTQQFAAIVSAAMVLGSAISFVAGYSIAKVLMN